jgi:hypothetical protein
MQLSSALARLGMRMKYFAYMIWALAILMSSCYNSARPVNPEAIRNAINEIDFNGKICRDEALLIAQNYMLTTTDEPCRSAIEKFDLEIGNPMDRGIMRYRENRDQHFHIKSKNTVYLVGFKRKGLIVTFEDDKAFYVAVDSKTGEPSCMGKWWFK